MRRKLYSLIAALVLCFSISIQASAANVLPITRQNSYTYRQSGQGTYEFTVPYTGNYEITLSGAAGASYNAASGGSGYTLSKTVRLQYNDTVKIVLQNKPSYYATGSTLTVPSGVRSQLYVNGTLVWNAAGGAGSLSTQIAPNGITSVRTFDGDSATSKDAGVHWHTGNGKSGATHSNTFPTVYSTATPNGCYVWGGHTHNATGTCGYKMVYTYDSRCDDKGYAPRNKPDGYNADGSTIWACCVCGSVNDGKYGAGFGGWCESTGAHAVSSEKVYLCGGYNNTWRLGCGYQQGQITPIHPVSPGQCYYADGWTPTATLSNTGNGNVTIKLVEQQTVYYNQTNAQTPYYMDGICNLIVQDNTVTYFKRR